MSRFIHLTLLLAVALMFAAPSVRAEEAAKSAKETRTDAAKKEGTTSKVPGEAKAAAEKAPGAKEAPKATKTPAGPPTLHPKVEIETTLGNIVVELDAEKAPISTMNFIRYAREGYYNNTIFHRVMKNFMIQGGGFTIDMEKKTEGLHPPIKNEWRNGLKNTRGTIAMARLGGDPDSATSQFFINVVNNPFLDTPQADGAAYTVFGKVVDGMDVVDQIRFTAVEKHPKYPSPQPVTPVVPVVIKSVKVLSNFDMNAAKAEVDKEKSESKAAKAEIEATAAKNKENQLQDVIAKIEKETGNPVVRTDSGLMYSVIKEGTGESPKPTDTVKVNYEGTLLNGKVFDSTYKRGKPIELPLNGVIEGWKEGIGMMKVGGSRYLIIPSELGYGSRRVSIIPPNSPLVFKVELLGIK